MIRSWYKSSSFRIAVAYVLIFSLALVALLSFVYYSAATEYEENLRKQVAEETERLRAVYKTDGLTSLIDKVKSRTQDSRLHGVYFELRDDEGRRSAGNIPAAEFKPGWGMTHIYEDPDDALEGDPTPLIAFGIELGDDARLIVGGNLERIDDLLEIMLGASSWALGLMAIFVVGGGLIIYRITMRRIAGISNASRSIMDGDLSMRLPLNGSGDELDGLTNSINDMLDRIEVLMEKMKKVTSDIAHDLRTPLSRLRQQLELGRDNELTTKGFRSAFDRAIVQTDELIETFNALLRIGQIDSGTAKARFAKIDISALVERIIETYTAVVEDQGQHIEAAIQPDLRIVGDPELLTQMLANLIENAVNHCPTGTRIVVELKSVSGMVTLTVSDDGPGIPSCERERVLQPFYRLEKSRTSDGSGLGLALVDAVAKLHGFDLTLSDDEPGLRIELRIVATESGAPISAPAGAPQTT